MTGKEIYKIWAPTNDKWVDWVRPVPFIAINDNLESYKTPDLSNSNINCINKDENTAIIVDLPGLESIKEGIALAKIGFRPIPVYNGTIEQDGAKATTDNKSISIGLVYGASKLKDIELENEAPPAFLLDSNRMNRFKMDVSVFDNSWDIYDQDVPSAEYFLNNQINKIVIISNLVQKDLKKILYKFQKQGIEIYFTNGYEKPKKINIRKPLQKEKE